MTLPIGSTIQYSFTPYFSYLLNLSTRSRRVLRIPGDTTSTTRSGVPRMPIGFTIRLFATETKVMSGMTKSLLDGSFSK
nr:hypothetical protein [Paenibacillus flagellatus]